jgi:hypothetical protein
MAADTPADDTAVGWYAEAAATSAVCLDDISLANRRERVRYPRRILVAMMNDPGVFWFIAALAIVFLALAVPFAIGDDPPPRPPDSSLDL